MFAIENLIFLPADQSHMVSYISEIMLKYPMWSWKSKDTFRYLESTVWKCTSHPKIQERIPINFMKNSQNLTKSPRFQN